MGQNCESHLSYLFFIMLVLILDFIFLSLFEVETIGLFEKYYLPKDNMNLNFKNDV